MGGEYGGWKGYRERQSDRRRGDGGGRGRKLDFSGETTVVGGRAGLKNSFHGWRKGERWGGARVRGFVPATEGQNPGTNAEEWKKKKGEHGPPG